MVINLRLLAINVLWLSTFSLADGLKYQFANTPKAVYEVTLVSEIADSRRTDSGRVTLEIKKDEKSAQQLSFYPSASIQSKYEGPHPGNASRGPSFPSPPFYGDPGRPEVTISDLGQVTKRVKVGSPTRLSSFADDAWEVFIQVLPNGNQTRWQTEYAVTLYSDSNDDPRNNRRIETPAHATVTYAIVKEEDNLLTIERKSELTSDEKVDDTPVIKQNNEGTFVFDKHAGMIQSVNFKSTVTINQKNITLKVPETLSARLLGPDEIAKIDAEQAKAAEEAKKRFAERKAVQEQIKREKQLPLPTAQAAAEQLKKVDSSWQTSKAKSVDLLANMIDSLDTELKPEADGSYLISDRKRIVSSKKFTPPVTFRAVVLTRNNDIRLGFAADQVIFNWDFNQSELRVDGGPVSGKHKPGAGKLPAAEWAGIEWVVNTDETIIYVNGKEIYRQPGDFSKINKPFSITSQHDDTLVKSVSVLK